jgi:peptidoglycan biosynthesis protein MviN/MurJ (putative lipid II flippase)
VLEEGSQREENPWEHRIAASYKEHGLISPLNLLGLLTAVIADILFAVYFGAWASADVSFVAFAVPQPISSMLLIFCESASVPIFTRFLATRGSGALSWSRFEA